MSEAVNTEKSAKKGFFKNIKSEFKKITWPKKDQLIKQSALVVVVSVALGLIIAVLDKFILLGLDKILIG